MKTTTEQSHRLAAHVRDGFSVALVGLPNVGKSSLLNALAARDVAIVTDVAGTTRDALSVPIELDGFLVNVIDTAGMRETTDKVEAIGVHRAVQAAQRADLVLWLIDERGEDAEIAACLQGSHVIKVASKKDLWSAGGFDLAVSVVTGEGLDGVLKAIQQRLLGDDLSLDHVLPMGRQRHAHHVEEAVRALALCEAQEELALLAESMREASAALGRITGAVDVEDVLDHIFSRFCIGK
jgi:tRNA modification GTPase